MVIMKYFQKLHKANIDVMHKNNSQKSKLAQKVRRE